MTLTPGNAARAAGDQLTPSELALAEALRRHDVAWGKELHRCRHARAIIRELEEQGYRLVTVELNRSILEHQP